MTFIKNKLVPIFIILVAAALIVVLALPLASTEWAESFRTGIADAEAEPFEAGDAPALLMIILPLVKVTLFMGVGGLLTMFIRWLGKRLLIASQTTV